MLEIKKEAKKQLGSVNPLKILDKWLKLALKTPALKKDKTWFMVLSTCYKNHVSSRVVLLKELSPPRGDGFLYELLKLKRTADKKEPFRRFKFLLAGVE